MFWTMRRPLPVVAGLAVLTRHAVGELAVHVVAYDDGPDMEALVDFRANVGGASFLEESNSAAVPFPPGSGPLEPAGVGLAGASGVLGQDPSGLGLGFGGQDPPQDFLPKQAERLMKNQCCNPEGCCDHPPDPTVEKSAIFTGPDMSSMPPSFLDVRASFLETDSSGRLVQVCAAALLTTLPPSSPLPPPKAHPSIQSTPARGFSDKVACSGPP